MKKHCSIMLHTKIIKYSKSQHNQIITLFEYNTAGGKEKIQMIAVKANEAFFNNALSKNI